MFGKKKSFLYTVKEHNIGILETKPAIKDYLKVEQFTPKLVQRVKM